MAKYDWNWFFGPNSVIGKLFGSRPTPTPTPVPTPVPVPTPSNLLTTTVSVNVPISSASITIDTLAPIQGTLAGNVATFISPSDHAGWGTQLTIKADGYQTYSERIILPLKSGPLAAVVLVEIPKVVAPKWTHAQLCDFQGDLMIFAPEIPGPSGVNIGAARGLSNGWHWTVYLPWYTPENRQKLYAKVRDFYKWTHIAIQVCEQTVGSKGYHDLQDPMSAEFCAGYGALMNVIHQEILDAGLIPVVAGPAPGPASQGGANLAAGFDASKALVAISDWDNTSYGAERIKFISDTFPNAILFYERPGPTASPSGLDKSPNVPNPVDVSLGNGGQWLKGIISQCPRFVGVLYEVNLWEADGVNKSVTELNAAHNGFWRDVQEVAFELNTYDKFWNGASPAEYDAVSAQVMARCPFLKGYMSGGAAHPVIVEAPPVQGTGAGELDPNSVSWVGGGGDIGGYAQTTRISQVNINQNGFNILFDKKDGAGRWPDNITPGWDGPLQFSIGVCCKVNGSWVGAAPIESWYSQENNKPGVGGPVTSQNVENSGKGQFALNWFYNSTWGPLNGYNPKPGEVIGVFVAAGDCRNNFNPVRERSQIVLLALPGESQSASFSF